MVTPIEGTPAELAVTTKRAVIIGPGDAQKFSPEMVRRSVEQGLRSSCTAPLLRHNRVIGVMTIASKREAVFTPDDGELIGASQLFKRILKQVETVAPTDSTVLIRGETGTGKELIARAIHSLSGRNERTLVKINCAAIPEALLESELFGHEKGAFTGAVTKKLGKFDLADGGTIFLDEIGDMSPPTQAKLLRVIQEHEFIPVGGNQTTKVDVRLIAASNRDLFLEVRE